MASHGSPRESCSLSPGECAAFETCGHVYLRGAFPAAVAQRMGERIWDELREKFGVARDDRGTWRELGRDLRRAKRDPEQAAIGSERVAAAVEALLGPGSWHPPASWGRAIVTFPRPGTSAWTVPTEVWHWDADLARNAAAPRGLLVFVFISTVGPRGGGTLIASGSHRLLQPFYADLSPAERRWKHARMRQAFLRWDPWLEALAGLGPGPADRVAFFMNECQTVKGVPVRIVELTGEPGDVVLCHPLILHAPGGNHANVPRFMRAKNLVRV